MMMARRKVSFMAPPLLPSFVEPPEKRHRFGSAPWSCEWRKSITTPPPPLDANANPYHGTRNSRYEWGEELLGYFGKEGGIPPPH